MNSPAWRVFAAFLATIAVFGARDARGANLFWQVTSGTWSIPSSWGGTLPALGDTAYIVNGGTANVTLPGAVCGTLSLGGSGSGAVLMNAGGLSTASESIGASGSGSFTQSGGTNAMSGGLYLGTNSGGSGTYNLSGGGLLSVTGTVGQYIGDIGSGSFTQSGGTNAVSGGLYFGTNSGGNGTYNLSSSGLLSVTGTGGEYIGYIGSGSFTQSGGTNAVSYGLLLGTGSGSSGTYNLSGSGLLSAGTVGEYIGFSGSGSFAQSSGTNAMPSGLYLGTNSGARGTYNLSGSGLLSVTGTIGQYIGFSGSGSFTQSGGTNAVTSGLLLGSSSGGSGTYNLSGSGLLSVTGTVGEYIGYFGRGSFTQSGGTNAVSYGLLLGSGSGSSGTYNLIGGLLNLAGLTQGSGSAAFNFSGGTFQAGSSFSTSMPIALSTSGSNLIFDTQANLLTLAGGLSGAGGLQKIGAGALLLSASNSYSGTTIVSGGTLAVAGAGGLGNGSYAGNITIANGALFNDNSPGPQTLAGVISGGGSLTQTASGLLTLTNSTAIANFTQSAGTLQIPSGVFSSVSVSVGTSFGSSAVFQQSGGTVSAGSFSVLGTYIFSGGAFNGRPVNGGRVFLTTSFYPSQGFENDTTISVPAGVALGVLAGSSSNTIDNEGSIALSGGTLAGGQAAGSGGPIVNNGVITGYGNLTSGVGINNNSQITQSGGNLTISAGTSDLVNNGAISLQSGFQFRLSGSTFTNAGTVNLNSSTIAGSGLMNNSSGNVFGPGTITAPFWNSGGILSVPVGTTNIVQPFVNSSSIQLSGFTANLTGGSIANSGSIQGNGLIANAVSNTGMIESINGTLTLSGSLQNNAGGLITAGAGSGVLVSSGLANNYGTINLIGGSYDNNSQPMANYAEISGYGTLRTGGLTNYGAVTLMGSTSTVNGAVTNAADGFVNVASNEAIFTGPVTDYGQLKATSTTVTFAGGYTEHGTYVSDPATQIFSSLTVDATGRVIGGVGDQFEVTGALRNAGLIDLGGTSTMSVGNGEGTVTQTAGTLEIGTGATLTAGAVQVNGGTLLADGPAATISASLVYSSSSASRFQGTLAGAGTSLTLNDPSAILVLSSSNSFTGGTIVNAGTLVLTSNLALQDGTSLTVGAGATQIFGSSTVGSADVSPAAAIAVPEPGTLVLLIAEAALIAMYRKRR
jgi:autotransporter-associated beta strand protein